MTTPTLKAKEEIKGMVRGKVLVPNDTGYDEARQIWNAMIDRRPALIAQCLQADDVPPIIQFARKNRLELAIRGAGHEANDDEHCIGWAREFFNVSKPYASAGADVNFMT